MATLNPPPRDASEHRPPLRAVDEPPHDPLAEQAILGAILRTADTDNDAAIRLLQQTPDPSDFYRPAHEELARLLRRHADEGIPLDPASVLGALTDAGALRRVADGPAIISLVQRAAPASSVEHLAGRVRRAAGLRFAQTQLARAQQRLAASDPDDTSVFYEAMDDLEKAARHGTHAGSRSIEYVSFTGLFSKPREAVQWLAEPILAAGRVTLLYSPGKTGKSLIAMEAAAALATGRGVLASDAREDKHHVLYVDQEMTEDDWVDRLSDMGYGQADETNLAQYLHLAQLQAWPPMDTAEGARMLLGEVEHTKASVVIIDTASKVIAGEENLNDTQQAFYRNSIVPLKRAGVAVLVLDHTGKELDRGARGGSAKTDNVDLAFEYVLRAKNHLTLRCSHARFRHPSLDEPTYLHRTLSPLTHMIVDDIGGAGSSLGMRPTHLMDKVSRFVEASPGCSRSTIETAKLGKTDYVRRAIDVLVEEGYLKPEKGPRGAVLHYSMNAYRDEQAR